MTPQGETSAAFDDSGYLTLKWGENSGRVYLLWDIYPSLTLCISAAKAAGGTTEDIYTLYPCTVNSLATTKEVYAYSGIHCIDDSQDIIKSVAIEETSIFWKLEELTSRRAV